MSHKSEEQWEEIGTCPICATPLYLMDGKIKWHDCPYNLDFMDDIIESVRKKTRQINDMTAKLRGNHGI